MLAPFISIFIFVVSSAPDVPPRPNFIVPVEFPDLGRYILLPIDTSPDKVEVPKTVKLSAAYTSLAAKLKYDVPARLYNLHQLSLLFVNFQY